MDGSRADRTDRDGISRGGDRNDRDNSGKRGPKENRHRRPAPSPWILFFPLAVFYLEIVLKISCGERVLTWGLAYVTLYSMGTGFLIAILCSFKSERVDRILSVLLLGAVSFLFCVQIVYSKILKAYLTISAFAVAGDALTSYWKEMLLGIFRVLPLIALAAAPLIFLLVKGKNIKRVVRPRHLNIVIFGVVISYLVSFCGAMLATSGITSISSIYKENFTMELAVPRFGLLSSTRLDIKYALFGRPEAEIVMEEESPESDGSETTQAAKIYGDNVLEIDFDALLAAETDETIANMHEYFGSVTPTSQNAYTGTFAGKNLVWLVGEAFSGLAVDEEVTPTLYKMATEGFVFENFYTPDTGFSTTGGEFMTMTSLIPSSVKSFPNTGDNDMPFGLGNLFSPLGYTTMAYHNHTYSYYGRDVSHPNLGYEYYGLENGLEVTKTWPASDLEMMELTVPEYIGDDNFHVYYMTVSGHMYYTFTGNSMAAKNRDAVEGLGLSEGAAAYLAANVELDRALQYMVEQFEAAGILEDTVFVLSGDHYPYGLADDEMAELLGYEMENPEFDRYRSTLILWSASMAEPVAVDKYCSSLDVLPTLTNLFGLPYDSRLMMGTDILSDSEPLVIFSNKSWISQQGLYDSKTDTFTSFLGEALPEGYVSNVTNAAYAKYAYSEKIVDYDYYKIVLSGEG